MPATKYLITGGCGFIGRTLIRKILQEEEMASIRVIDDLSSGTRNDLLDVCQFNETDPNEVTEMTQSGVELVVGDIKDAQLAQRVSFGAETIIHLAANTGVQPSIENPRFDMQNNILGTLNYLEAARHNDVGKFIFASSGAPVGNAPPPFHEEVPCRPISPYGASKLAGEAYCSAYHGSYGVDTICLRFSNVYGPLSGKKGSVVAKFLRLALEGKPWVINGGGQQTRDFIYSEDLAKAILMAANSEHGGELFQVATGTETSILALAEKLETLLAQRAGMSVEITFGPELVGDVARNFADIDRIQARLGWRPTMDLDTGLENTLDWFLSVNKEDRG